MHMFKKLGLGCLTIIGLLVVLGIIGAAMGGGTQRTTATLVATAAPAALSGDASVVAAPRAPLPTAEPAPTTAAPQSYNVGDVVQLGDLAFTVLGWSKPAATQFAKPKADQTFVGVELLLVNQGQQAANLSSLAQMSLKDSADRRYTVDLLAATAIGETAPDGELAPGEQLRGAVGFQLPSDASGLTFVFDAGLFSSGKIFIALGPEPIRVEPPAALASAAAPQTAALGAPIPVGDLTLTVNGMSSPEGSQFSQPAEGKRFLVVDLSITNSGSQAANVSTMLQMKLKDASGRQYTLDLLATTAAGGAAPEGELAPGETVRGPVGFQVPSDASGLLFVFDGNVFGAGKTFIQLP
jgi:hypothetical protein